MRVHTKVSKEFALRLQANAKACATVSSLPLLPVFAKLINHGYANTCYNQIVLYTCAHTFSAYGCSYVPKYHIDLS